jgi:hypothetical protein
MRSFPGPRVIVAIAAVAIAAVVIALEAGGTSNSTSQRLGTGGAPASPRDLAAQIDRAQQVIDEPSTTSRALASAALLEQLATRALAGESTQARRATLARLGRRAAVTMRVDLVAAAALSRLAGGPQRLPHWRIVRPPAPSTMLGYFRAAESRFGVPWQDLAAIELIETRFGRVHGVSSAGARGPMQFLPATWARYGRGSIEDQRDAILGAARYLAANGAPRAMANALYHYNNSRDYVHAVEDYARAMRADIRAYYGYYYWQVIFDRIGGDVLLPVGYPKSRPIRLS